MKKELILLRKLMKQHGIDAYYIPDTDDHSSEFVNDYFRCRAYISGFTGSSGTLLVTQEDAWLWTDSRYYLQAEKQLAGSGIRLMKEGEKGVPDVFTHLASLIDKPDFCLGFDGRTIESEVGGKFSSLCRACWDIDLVDVIWENRPALKPSRIYSLSDSVTGETAEDKLRRVRAQLAEKNADWHLMTRLEEIAWLFNLRASDIPHTPVFYAYALISRKEARLYVLDDNFHGNDDVTVWPYLQIYDDLQKIVKHSCLLDLSMVNYGLIKKISSSVEIVNHTNPIRTMKAVKNPTEISATKSAHSKDGAAVAEFIYWLKYEANIAEVSELDASDYLESCRRKQIGFMDLSFETIAGYGANGALPHYDPKQGENQLLSMNQFFLVDSGGQYCDGTTDITRTIALGTVSEEMRRHYTQVLRSHIALASAVFPAGTTGRELDEIARKPMQEAGLNYGHGTGHGIGHLLSVHEAPPLISPYGDSFMPQPGMIHSDEPGLYLQNRYGIRLENELLCVNKQEDLYGYEPITFCPFDRYAILPELLTDEELTWLNQYHAKTFEVLAPLLPEKIKSWLAEETKPIHRNPIATIEMENGSKVIIELLPETAPNAVYSFISLAKQGCFDHHPVERVLKDAWIDMTFTAFGQESCRYFIENDLKNPNIKSRPSVKAGTVVMGCYDNGISGCEFGFPLEDLPFIDEMAPVFGLVRDGMDELVRLGKVETLMIENKYHNSIKLLYPKEKQVVKSVTVETFGITYPEPKKIIMPYEEQPKNWYDETYLTLFN